MYRPLAVFVFSLSSFGTWAQEYTLKRTILTFEDGLASREMETAYLDSRGFTWFGMTGGLNRYDGQSLQVFTQESGALAYNNVGQINEDINGKLWLLHTIPPSDRVAALSIFDPITNNTVSTEEYLGSNPPFSVDDLKLMSHSISPDHILFVTKSNDVYHYDGKTLRTQPLFNHKGNIDVIYLRDSHIWIIGTPNTIKIDIQGNVIKQLNRDLFHLQGIDSLGRFIHVNNDQDGETQQLNYVYADDEPIFYTQDHPDLDGEFSKILGVDLHNHRVWVNHTRNGQVNVFSFEGKKFLDFPQTGEIFNPYFPSPWVGSNGNLWGRQNGKVFGFIPRSIRFETYLTDGPEHGPEGYNGRGMQIVDNKLYVNGLGNTYKIDLAKKQRQRIISSTNFYSWVDGRPRPLEESRRLAMLYDRDGNLWFTDEGMRLSQINPATLDTKDFYYVQQARALLKPPSLHWSLHQDQYGKLWLGHVNGLSYFTDSDSVNVYAEDYGNFKTFGESTVYHFHERGDTLWLATSTGLYLFDQQHGIVDRYHEDGPVGRRIPHDHIAHISEFEKDTLWLASKGGGIIRLSLNDNSFEQFTIESGLSHNETYGIHQDDYGYMWVSSSDGLMQINKDDFSINVYYKSDGLAHDEFNTISHVQSEDGILAFGGLNGISVFDPADFAGSNNRIELLVTEFIKQTKADGEYHDSIEELLSESEIHIYPDNLGFEIRYSVIDYLSERFAYAYMIKGIDQQWNNTTEPVVLVRSLPYGNYELLVKGKGSAGRHTEVVSIPIIVHRPFYLQLWFYVVSFFLAVGLVILFVRYRLKNLKKTQKLLEEQVQERTKVIQKQASELKDLDKLKSRFFANISHELKTPLSLIIGPVSELLKNGGLDQGMKSDLNLIERSGRKIQALVNEILDLSRLDNRKIDPNYVPVNLSRFMEEIFANFKFQAQRHNVEYQYSFDGDKDLVAEIEQKMVDKILNNLLANAFKFTPEGGEVSMCIKIEADTFVVEVRDNGRGINEKDLNRIFDRFYQTSDTSRPAEGGWGIGLAMSNELAELLNGKINVESDGKSGSSFTLELPLKIVQTDFTESDIEEVMDATASSSTTENVQEVSRQDHILVVEDHVELQSFLKEKMSNDYQVSSCTNGKKALVFLENNHESISAIITDIMMPEMDGVTLLRTLKEDERFRAIPVIILTARTVDEIKLEAFRLGVDDYLLKPFSIDELKARLKNILKYSKHRQIEAQAFDHDGEEVEYNFDESWLSEVKSTIKDHVGDHDFNLTMVANKMGLGDRQFQRKLKKMTGYTPVVYLKEIRMQLARKYLEERSFNQVGKVAIAVGFADTAYFSKLYKERFGVLPRVYLLK